jgi:SAM-dependent methyltransferase
MQKQLLKEKLVIFFAEPVFNYDARRRFKKYIRSEDQILDIGALTSPFTKGLNNKVIAIDILPDNNAFGFSERTLNKLKKRQNIEPIVMDAQKLDFGNNRFDIVILTEVLEHIPNDIIASEEIIRVLKPGGFLLLTVPNLERVPLEYGIKEHLRHYLKNDLIKLFGKENILFITDRFKFNEFNWASYFISRYNISKNKLFLLFLPFEALLKNFVSYLWLPFTEKFFKKTPGYNLIMILQKRS